MSSASPRLWANCLMLLLGPLHVLIAIALNFLLFLLLLKRIVLIIVPLPVWQALWKGAQPSVVRWSQARAERLEHRLDGGLSVPREAGREVTADGSAGGPDRPIPGRASGGV